MVGRISRS
jgi:SulP family sulfate permease